VPTFAGIERLTTKVIASYRFVADPSFSEANGGNRCIAAVARENLTGSKGSFAEIQASKLSGCSEFWQ